MKRAILALSMLALLFVAPAVFGQAQKGTITVTVVADDVFSTSMVPLATEVGAFSVNVLTSIPLVIATAALEIVTLAVPEMLSKVPAEPAK